METERFGLYQCRHPIPWSEVLVECFDPERIQPRRTSPNNISPEEPEWPGELCCGMDIGFNPVADGFISSSRHTTRSVATRCGRSRPEHRSLRPNSSGCRSCDCCKPKRTTPCGTVPRAGSSVPSVARTPDRGRRRPSAPGRTLPDRRTGAFPFRRSFAASSRRQLSWRWR